MANNPQINDEGTKYWRNEKDQLHREDGPAVEYANGAKEWYQQDQLHREDGPARECANGAKEWYQNGRLHRLDGPAAEYTNGHKYWRIEGEIYSEENYPNAVQKYYEKTIKAAAQVVTQQKTFNLLIDELIAISADESRKDKLKVIGDMVAELGV